MYRKESNGIQVLIMTVLMGALVLVGVLLLQSGRTTAETHPTVHIFSADQAPTDGVVAVHVQYGVDNVPEGWLVGKWEVGAGEHIDRQIKIPSGKYARVWFRSANSMMWTLLPSQYWHGGGSCGDEFGVSARSDHPSYHTRFASGIVQSAVPLLTRLDECPYGSFTYNNQAVSAPVVATGVPTMTPVPTVAPTATPCIELRSGDDLGC